MVDGTVEVSANSEGGDGWRKGVERLLKIISEHKCRERRREGREGLTND